MVEDEKKTLVNGQPIEGGNPPEDEIDEGTTSPGDEESGDVHGDGDSSVSNEQAGTGSPDDQGGEKEPLDIPGSVGEIKQGVKDRIERLKKDGPEPIREAAKGLVDKAFDVVDAGFEKWFSRKK